MGPKSQNLIFQRETPSGAGERRYATVMFADIADSTRLISGLDIEDTRDLLDSFLHEATAAIHQFGGTVARVQGDGILALFGAPVASEDHAQRAAMAGLAIRDLCLEKADKPAGVSARIGIHCGELGLRWQNHDFGKSLDVIGTAVHVAAKLQECAPINSVMVSGTHRDQLGVQFDTAPTAHRLQGEDNKPLTVHHLIALSPGTAANNHAKEAIFGREPVIQLIEQIVSGQAANGTADVSQVGFTGAPGIGKTRLLDEAENLAQANGRDVLRIVGRSLDRSIPYGALANTQLKRPSPLSGGARTDSGTDMGPDIGPDAIQTVDLRREMDRFPGTVEGWDELSPDARSEYTDQHFLAKIAALTSPGGLVVIADDFHFLDSESKRLLIRLSKQLRSENGVLIVGTRPECQEEVAEFVQTNHVLAPLSEGAANLFVRQLWTASGMEREVLPNTIGQTIQHRAQGMPLALRHFSAHCFDLIKEGKDPLLALPHQLDTIFRSQIDGLNDRLRTIFQIGCVLGYEFDFATLSGLTGLPETEIRAGLDDLCGRELLIRLEEDRYRFVHQLLQEAGYFGILRGQLSKLHKQAYDLLSAKQEEQRVSPQILGWHAARAGLPEQALDHYASGMKEAIARGAILTVDELYAQARRLCEQLGAEGRGRRALFLLHAFDAMQQLGKQEWYRADVEDAAAYFAEQGDNFRHTLAICHVAITDWTGARNRKSLIAAREGERLAQRLGHEPLIIYSQFTLGNIEYLCGEPQSGIARLKSLVERLGGVKKTARFGDMISVPGIMARTFSSWYLYDVGETDLAREYCEQGSALARVINQNYSNVLAGLAEAYLLYRDDDFAAASKLLEGVLTLCADKAIYGLETIASARYVCSLVQEGELDKAARILARHQTEGHLAPVQHSCAYYLWEGEARLHAARGDYRKALSVLDHARAESERQNDPLHALHGRILACEIMQSTGIRSDIDAGAFAHELNEIEQAASGFGFSPIAARCQRLRGDKDQSRGEL